MGSQASATDVPELPHPIASAVAPGITLLEPLSRRGTGPGLILLTPPGGDSLEIKDGVPSALIKWAEEGYTVAQIEKQAFEESDAPLQTALQALSSCSKCTSADRVGLISFEPALWNLVASKLPEVPAIVSVVLYGDVLSSKDLSASSIPTLQHLAGKSKEKLPRTEALIAHEYPQAASYMFATPSEPHFDYAAEGVSHTRSLTHLKRAMNGPYFDLEAIWDEHTYWEFENRSVEQTMATMVQEPYVNHVPTLTGGIGRGPLSSFYAHHFIFNNPADTELELISRTVGIDRVVDEFIYKFTHDSMVDWLIPGIPPTYKRVEIPFTAVVNIRGDRLYHEHIAWDQASVLKQLDLLPDYLPFQYKNAEGRAPAAGKRFEYRLPVAGMETSNKMRDKHSLASNQMFDFAVREVDDK